jgi:hypothetical protein
LRSPKCEQKCVTSADKFVNVVSDEKSVRTICWLQALALASLNAAMATDRAVRRVMGRALWDPHPTVTDLRARQLAAALGYPHGWRVVRTIEKCPVAVSTTDAPVASSTEGRLVEETFVDGSVAKASVNNAASKDENESSGNSKSTTKTPEIAGQGLSTEDDVVPNEHLSGPATDEATLESVGVDPSAKPIKTDPDATPVECVSSSTPGVKSEPSNSSSKEFQDESVTRDTNCSVKAEEIQSTVFETSTSSESPVAEDGDPTEKERAMETVLLSAKADLVSSEHIPGSAPDQASLEAVAIDSTATSIKKETDMATVECVSSSMPDGTELLDESVKGDTSSSVKVEELQKTELEADASPSGAEVEVPPEKEEAKVRIDMVPCLVDRIYSGRPGSGSDMWFHHGDAWKAASLWVDGESHSKSFQGGHLLPRQPKFRKGDVVQGKTTSEHRQSTTCLSHVSLLLYALQFFMTSNGGRRQF